MEGSISRCSWLRSRLVQRSTGHWTRLYCSLRETFSGAHMPHVRAEKSAHRYNNRNFSQNSATKRHENAHASWRLWDTTGKRRVENFLRTTQDFGKHSEHTRILRRKFHRQKRTVLGFHNHDEMTTNDWNATETSEGVSTSETVQQRELDEKLAPTRDWIFCTSS